MALCDSTAPPCSELHIMGMTFAEMERAEFPADRLPKVAGIQVKSVLSSSEAFRAGVRPNDIVVEVNNKPVPGLSDVTGILRDHAIGTPVYLLLYSNQNWRFVALTMTDCPDEE